ncbi:MAG: hypothetical protein ACD_78C00362G0001, partial [uncultured bacterium (gcode 4)]
MSSIETRRGVSLQFPFATANASGLISTANVCNVETYCNTSLLHSDKIEIGIIPEPVPTSMRISGCR